VPHPLTDLPGQVERIAEFAARNNRIPADSTRKGDDLRRWCTMMQVVASTTVSAPKATVWDVYGDYPSWPRLFPTINGVRLLRRDGATLVLEIDHIEGTVVNELLVRPPDEISLSEVHRRFDALFCNRFETIPGGTRFTVTGEFHLKGLAKLLQPFLRGYARRRMGRLQLQPVKAEAEARARRTADSEPAKNDTPGQ
jgi:polyketide cyclase/dehydrase/lipid transport protein